MQPSTISDTRNTVSESLELDDALLAQLPCAPSQVLLLGASADQYVGQLVSLGYQVSLFDLGCGRELIQWPTANRHAIYDIELPLSDMQEASFGASIIVGLSAEIHPLSLWGQLGRWLAPESPVVILRPGARPQFGVQNGFEHFCAIGARLGFSKQESASTAGTEAHVLRYTGRPRWQLRNGSAKNFAEIAVLFQKVFGHPLSRDLWNWKYSNGRGNAVVAARNGALIAHYGGMYRDILLCGSPDWALQICDVMVHPDERGVMTRQGPFLLTAACSAEVYGPLGFGFPNARAMLVAKKMKLYDEAGQMAEVRWPPAAKRPRWRTRVAALKRDGAGNQETVDSLWARMAQDLRQGVVGVRNWAFVEHRYFNHPHNNYEVLLVSSRLAREPLGVMVMRRLGESCELLDVIAPLANLPLLIDQARRLTALWNLPFLYCWITENYLPQLLVCGGSEKKLDVTIPTSCWSGDPRANLLNNNWWLMSGDTDFR